ncbi:hypothetical protein HMPREF1582_00370 [Gardnerella vaginalis JCP8151A]|nr:hypothetical protein HMPREF1582_00370 [Gardnerella vaginalis JCP8151A]
MSKKITRVTKHKATTRSIVNTILGILITLAMSTSLFAAPETAYASENKINSCITATQKSDNSTKIIVAGSWFDGVKNFWKSVFKDKNKDGKKDEKSNEKGKKDENSKKHIEVVDENGLTAEERNKAKSDNKKSKKKQTRKKKKNRKNRKRKNSKNGIKRKKKTTTRKRKRVNRKRKNSVKVLRSNTNRNAGNSGNNGNNGDASKNTSNDHKQNQAPTPAPAPQQQPQQQVQTPAPAPAPAPTPAPAPAPAPAPTPAPQQQTPQNSGAMVVHPGAFCSSGPGVEAVSPKGVPMVCSDTGEGRTRWRRR